VSYKFFFTAATAQYIQNLGPNLAGAWLASVPDPSTIVDGNWVLADPPLAYTPDTGAAAWTSLLNFIADQRGTGEGRNKALDLVSATKTNFMTSDYQHMQLYYLIQEGVLLVLVVLDRNY